MSQITALALDYHNCRRDPAVEQLLQHLDHAPTPPALRQEPPGAAWPCCNTVVLPSWHALAPTHNVCELCVNQTAGGLRPGRLSLARCSFVQMAAARDAFYLKGHAFEHGTAPGPECRNFLSSYSPFSYYSACCRTMSRRLVGLLGSPQGPQPSYPSPPSRAFSPPGEEEEECKVGRPGPVPHIEETRFLVPPRADIAGFTGLGCRTNKTLNMYLLDSNLFWVYAERLGAPGTARQREFAAIVDLKEESHYILEPSQALVKVALGMYLPKP